MDVPDFVEPIIGYRGWLKRGTELYSLYYHGEAWTNEVNVAYCQCCKESPLPFCTGLGHSCGIYAFKDQTDLFDYLYEIHIDLIYSWFTWYEQPKDIWLVNGMVLLWGTVIEHEKGYRAQYAKVLGTPRHFCDYDTRVLHERGFYDRKSRNKP